MKRMSLAIALGAVVATSGIGWTQSPWSALARKIAIQPKADAASVTGRVVAANQEGMAMAAPQGIPEVPNENPLASVIRPNGMTPQMASINQTDGLLPGNGGSGLATKLNANSKGTTIDLGRESDDSATIMASNLFKNPEILRMLGDQPRFIYNAGDKPDPMLVPWVRRAAIFKELMTQADALTAAGKLDDVVKVLQKIADLKDLRFTPIVQARLAAINTQKSQQSQQAIAADVAVETKLELPAWVQDNTVGSLVSPSGAVCLVGDYVLHAGEAIPAYPEVKVAVITPQSITYQIKDKQFKVAVTREDETSTKSKK